MSNSLALLALSGLLPFNTGTEKPAWLADYAAARQIGRATQKPLVVVIGSGQEGWEKMSQEGKLGKEVNRALAGNYVCVYVDTADPWGQRLAAAFAMNQGPGLVISDRSGDVQAFSHQGTLTEANLADRLRRHADPQRVVRQTETNVSQRVSYYPPSYQQVPASSYAPVFSGGRGC